MTTRRELDQRRREAQVALLGRVAARSFSRRTTGVDGLVKKLVAGQAPPIDDDPDLEHPDHEWQVPGPERG